jgi:hypothetical protein
MTDALKEKQQEFLSELNERLPRGVHAQYRPSQSMPNVLNVLIMGGNIGLELFGLIEDKDGSIHWFQNLTGALY